MCGIFGMLGGGSVGRTVEALRYLEYRGYDSAGIAASVNGKLRVYKSVGRIDRLQSVIPSDLDSDRTIGHTRWATHGAVSYDNAHPFVSSDNSFAVVHNGIIENYLALKKQLSLRGTVFTSQTDSETVAHVLQHHYKTDVLQAVIATANCLAGAYAIVISTTHDGNLYAIKDKSPLVVGLSDDGAYLCSDVRCVSRWASKVAVVPDKTVIAVSANGVEFYDYDGKRVTAQYFDAERSETETDTCGDFMLKEISEIPDRLRQVTSGYYADGGLGMPRELALQLRRIYMIGCGTAYNSGLHAASVARAFSDVDIIPVIASEYIYGHYPTDAGTLAILISQSGETADTIRAAEKVAAQGGITYAVTNTKSSSLCFKCRCVNYIYAGGEFAVASTKAYNCQLVTLLLILADIARLRGTLDPARHQRLLDSVKALPESAERALADSAQIKRLALQIKDSSAVFYIGRVNDYSTACEGSLKLKEISYIHSEAYPAGELKHGTLALMERGVTVIAICTEPALKQKIAASVSEITARGARVITVAPFTIEGCDGIILPQCDASVGGVIAVIPLQLLAYYAAKALNRDVDKPRNLAKSVTVE